MGKDVVRKVSKEEWALHLIAIRKAAAELDPRRAYYRDPRTGLGYEETFGVAQEHGPGSICSCPIHNLMNHIGHDEDCPER